MTGDTSESAMFASLTIKLETKLENIHKSTLRGEYKLKIYSQHAFPSMRYFVNVHHITKTHMDKLDNIVRKYFKLWLRIPKHGVTDASIYHSYMLNIKTPSQYTKKLMHQHMQ